MMNRYRPETYQDLIRLLTGPQDPVRLTPQYWAAQAAGWGEGFFAEILYLLTRLRYEDDQAEELWMGLIEHQGGLSRALGRDPGLQAALCDYLVNVRHEVRSPLIIELGLFMQQEEHTLRDELTGLYNRRFFNEIMLRQISVGQRSQKPFSLLMADVDQFKRFNDTHGHIEGDRALCRLAQVMSQTLRDMDYLVRFGGEEFAMVLPDTAKPQALVAAERIRRMVNRSGFETKGGKVETLSLSIGVASFPDDASTVLDLVHRADMALYSSKESGRDRVCSSGPDRRRHPRYAARGDVWLVSGDDGRFVSAGSLIDLSLSGLKVASNVRLAHNAPLSLTVLPEGDDMPLAASGRAVRVIKAGNGNGQSYQLGIALDKSLKHKNLWRDLVQTGLKEMKKFSDHLFLGVGYGHEKAVTKSEEKAGPKAESPEDKASQRQGL